ncbi:hypothetical protein BDA96_04G289300 [Sorghum bicolor]|uniref:Uncharacterized protein n=2 Tax=Sorghum bicolor TaxID=4558 RepID=A0A194YRY9_SORBI|nr:glutamic acid-rich protein-like isoform X1 [Sorghum bicolor]KAG0534547.1 hypothetical protein BDA96_04G289300 [Sorghum bicolor]KXG30941.1 hypothetical protein SORBI_3004G271500 [Sorghum bicolor]|eukprot:XP_021313828.1 glutamic acid-rich protein-like isoform X1 [Sorghum bicolor]
MEAATAMDFHSLSRRELQALCKRNGVRANMTNSAMADALQGLDSVDGIDEIGTTLCLPTPGRSAMKSAAKMVAVEEQQHGSPLPRGRRVSVKSPEAIRMEVEGGEDEVKEIVKTPGVALRSTRRGTRATPAPLPTPVAACSTRATARRTAARKTGEVVPTPATRRSQRTASRKAAEAVEADRPADDVPEEKISKMTIALDQEAEVVAAASKEEKVHNDEPKADSCDETTVSAAVLVKSCNDPKVEEVVVVMEEQSAKPHEGIVKELEPISVETSALLTVMDDSPILGVVEKEQGASVEDCEDLAESPAREIIPVTEDKDLAESPAREMTDEIIPVTEDKEVAISEEVVTEDNGVAISVEATEYKEVAIIEEVAINEEAVKEDGFANTVETDSTPEEILTAAGEDETIEEGEEDKTIEEGEVILTEGKESAAEEMLQAGETSEEDEEEYLTELKQGAADEVLQAELADSETSEEDEDDLSEEREGAAAKMLQGEMTEDEISEEDGLDEDEEWSSDDDENTEEIGSTDESDEDTDESSEVQMLQGTGITEEANEDASTEDDDFSGDLPPEFDNIMIFSDAETESDIAPPVLEENQAAVASATKTAKSLDDSAMSSEQEGPEVDNIVKSLDEFTFKEGESEEMQKEQPQDYNSMSLRKLKSTYKKCLIAQKEGKQEEVTEGKRLPLEEVDENACINH